MGSKTKTKSKGNTGKVVGSLAVAEMSGEFDASFKDVRLTRRTRALGNALSGQPDQSLPKLLDPAALEGAYRLLNHDDVHWRALHEPHHVQTLRRSMDAAAPVLIIHDTTEITFARYSSERLRSGLVSPSSRTQGMQLHVSFAVSGGEVPVPLGTLRAQPFVHAKHANAAGAETVAFWHAEAGLFDNEMRRWFDGVMQTQAHMGDLGVDAVHVADCEIDSFGLIAAMVERSIGMVVRCDGTRNLERGEVREVGIATIALGERGDLRPDRKVKAHPTRSARNAKVRMRAGSVTFKGASSRAQASWSPDPWEEQPHKITMNLVEVEEINPPAGEPPVRWLLLTTLPVDTAAQALQVVQYYRRRWIIEEFFKALKTGCGLQQRQMESASAMLNMTALLLPVAWRLLALRTIGEQQPDADWSAILTPIEFEVLLARNNGRSRSPRYQLTPDATAAQVLAAVARLGGHIPRNGRPGWQTLYAGWDKLSQLVEGAILMKAIQRRRR